MTTISVCIPVGPEAHHAAYLPEALQSVAEQTRQADEVVLVDDMANLTADDLKPLMREGDIVDGDDGFAIRVNHQVGYDERRGSFYRPFARVWRSPWRLGVAAAFNAGIGLATGDLIFMLGADDRLLPNCLEQCVKAYEKHGNKDAFYWVGVQYSDGRPDQFLPCNTAAVTKGLWRLTGGFPPEVGSGACDAALVSVLMVHAADRLICVNGREPLAWYRVGENTDTAQRGPWQSVILATRDLLTRTWRQPEWNRYS